MRRKGYLKRQGETWYFQLAVPRSLRSQFGKKVIVEALGTRDVEIAKRMVAPRIERYRRQFDRIRTGQPLSPLDIAEEAQRAYDGMLSALEALPPRMPPEVDPETCEERDTPEATAISAMIDVYADAIEVDDFSAVAGDVEAAGKRLGVAIEPGSRTCRMLGEALLDARIKALDTRRRALRGEVAERPTFGVEPPVPAPRPAPQRGNGRNGLPFSEVGKLFLAERQRDPEEGMTEKSRLRYQTAFRLFGQFVNEASPATVTRATATKFLDMIATLSPNWGKGRGVKAMPLAKLLEKFGHSDAHLSNPQVNGYATLLKTFFEWAQQRGHVPEGAANPFAKQTRGVGKGRKGGKKQRGWLPYKIDELNTLFAAVPLDWNDPMRWLPLVSLFSGARVGEIAQLRTTDVGRSGETWYLDIREEGEGQSVKTEAGIRKVPVHSMLERCGLLEYAKTLPDGQLFPGLRPGGPDRRIGFTFSDTFTEFRRGVGITRPQVSFHSFRKNFTTCLDNAGVPETDIQALIGHERGFTLKTYSGGLALERLQKIVEKVQYPGVNLKHLHVK
jgi:integrase